MDTWMSASLAGREQIVRERQERLRAEAADERLARAARAPHPLSPARVNRMHIVARALSVGATGGTNR
jgi:hypothetical protein